MISADRSCNLCGATDADLLVLKDGFNVVRCRRCRLVYVSNPPDSQELSRLYSFNGGYHTELTVDAVSVALHEGEAQRYVGILEALRTPGRLLDVGCSTGLFLKAAQRAGWSVKGIEYSNDTADTARGVHGLDVHTGSLDEGALEGERFDVITMWDVLEHVPDPRAMLVRARALLPSEGLLIIKTPNVDGWFPRLSLLPAGILQFWAHPEPPGHLFQFSRRTVEALLGATGFRVVDVRYGRIPIRYSFGTPRRWFRSIRWALYCLAFIPVALIAPYFRAGDDMIVVARPK